MTRPRIIAAAVTATLLAALTLWQWRRDAEIRDCLGAGGFWTGRTCLPAQPDSRKA
jgi:hypothetical protein